MGKRRMQMLSLLAASALLFSACGHSGNLTAGLTPQQGTAGGQQAGERQVADAKGAVMDFSVKLLKACGEGEENVLLSPVSVLCALGMAESGAGGDTRTQMEAAFGVDGVGMNDFLGSYVRGLPSGENYKFHIADSIWLNESKEMQIEDAFLQTNVDNYDAEIYEVPFGEKAKSQINDWTKENTDGMIPEILDEMNPDGVACLVNAVAFDAKWREPYEEYQVSDGVFTMEDGREQSAKMMNGEEFHYLEGDNETGFVKYYEYADGEETYAFVALLPEEGLSMADYLASLSGGELSELLENEKSEVVVTALPKFEVEYGQTLNPVLQEMGVTDAFDAERADFSGMGSCPDGNIYISEVIHKTYIAVDEEGTRAGAATAVEMDAGAAMPEREVLLNRPFVYLIVDCENRVPIFLGIVRDLGTEETAEGADAPVTDCRAAVEEPPEEVQKPEPPEAGAWKRMVMLDGKLFVETGEIESGPRCGVMDGTITSTTDGEPPTKDNQSNFGKDIGYQYGMRENRIVVRIDDEWRVFAYNENNLEGMTMSVSGESPTGCTVTFQNESGRELTFGEDFKLERLDEEIGWTFVPIVVEGEYGFHDIGYPVADGESRDWEVDWNWLYGELEPGTYRIIKDVVDSDGKGHTKYTLSVEFGL